MCAQPCLRSDGCHAEVLSGTNRNCLPANSALRPAEQAQAVQPENDLQGVEAQTGAGLCHSHRCTIMRPRQINKTSIAGINRVQPNHHRKVITKLLKIDQCVASLKMLVMMQGNSRVGCSRLARKKVCSPQLIAGTEQINHQTGNGAVGDDLLGQRKPGVKIAGVLIRCSSSNQLLQIARDDADKAKGPINPMLSSWWRRSGERTDTAPLVIEAVERPATLLVDQLQRICTEVVVNGWTILTTLAVAFEARQSIRHRPLQGRPRSPTNCSRSWCSASKRIQR